MPVTAAIVDESRKEILNSVPIRRSVGVQHLMGQSVNICRALVQLGLKPENIFLAGKFIPAMKPLLFNS